MGLDVEAIIIAFGSGVIGLVGVGIGAWLTERGERARRRLAFMERRLNEFYAPLLGLRKEIQAKSALRFLIENAGHEGWHTAVAKMGEDARYRSTDKEFEPYQKLLEYNSRQFKDELLPAYRRMATLFRKSMSLAYPDTAEHFGKLIEYVSIWDRHMEGAIPPHVLPLLKHGEKNLHPLYESLQRRHDELVTKIAQGQTD